jgi:hypothetical protein
MALIVYLKLSVPLYSKPVGIFGEVRLPIGEENISVLILKADIRKPHYLEGWDQQLMFVRNAHVVQSPKGPVPSLVGLYDIDKEIAQCTGVPVVGKSLLFQSAIDGTYKFLPLIADWKLSKPVSLASNVVKYAVVHQIESASQVMQNVANDERSPACRELSDKHNENTVSPFVFLNADGVKLGRGKINQELIQVVDVLHGPFNLFP